MTDKDYLLAAILIVILMLVTAIYLMTVLSIAPWLTDIREACSVK